MNEITIGLVVVSLVGLGLLYIFGGNNDQAA